MTPTAPSSKASAAPLVGRRLATPRGVVSPSARPKWIYLWLTPRSSSKPRADRVRYDERLYAQVLKAEQKVQHGGTVRVAKRHDTPGRRGEALAGSKLPAFELRTYHEPPLRPPAKRH